MSEPKQNNKKHLIIGAAALLVLIAVLALVYPKLSGKTAMAGAKTIEVTIVHKDKSEKQLSIATDAAFLRGALEEKDLIAGNESSMGLYVLTVDGETVDESKQQWWCVTKGGEPVMNGVDMQPVSDGEHYELTFTEGW